MNLNNLTLVAAVSENNVIGINNKIPWRIKEDMEHFKNITLYKPVIMGRKTYESIPEKFRPLPLRKNIVLSRTLEQKEGIYIARNVDEALKLCEDYDASIIGGAEIYKIFLPLSNKIELTRVNAKFDGDAFFPAVDWEMWDLIKEEQRQNEAGLNFSFLTYKLKI